MSLVVNKKERVILLKSHIIDDYMWFKKFLKTNDKITSKLIASLPEQQRNFIKYMLKELLQQAILEWKEKPIPPKDLGEDKKKWVKCTLCGTPNRFIHYILNRQNGTEMNVGSECVKEFAFNDLSTDYQRKEAKKIRRLSLLNENLPGIKQQVENWQRLKETYSIWIPDEISTKYDEIGYELRNLYDNFIDGKGKEADLDKLSTLLKQGEGEKEKFKKYEEINNSNPFIVTQKMFRWLRNNKEKDYIKPIFLEIKSQGIITYRTAHRITEVDFMKKVISLMNPYLQEKEIELIDFDNLERKYFFGCKQLDSCEFVISHSNLLQNFGWVMFNEEPFMEINLKELVKQSSVENEKSIEVILRTIVRNLRSKVISLIGYDYEFNEVVLFNKERKIHQLLKLNEFVKKYKVLSVDNDERLKLIMEAEIGRKIDFRDYQQSREAFTYLTGVGV